MFCTDRPKYYGLASFPLTTVTQYRRTVLMNKLSIVGERGLLCVTPLKHLKGGMWYTPTFATMVRCSQYVLIVKISQGPTPYPAIISRHLSWSKAE